MLPPAPPSLTVWAARTFGTAVHSLAALRSNPDGCAIRLLVSHVRPDSPTLSAADVAFQEPALTGPAWVAWALNVCEREQVDVLWVTQEAPAAAAAQEAFAAVGTRLLIPSSAAITATVAKSDVYGRAELLGLPTPPWQHAVGPEQARAAIRRLHPLSEYGVCVKPDTGQGAAGVHRLVDAWDDLPVGVDLPQQLWLEHVGRHPQVAWLVLPWLPGAEHSVDALRSRDGRLLASVVRTKQDRSYEQRAWGEPSLTAMSATLLADLDLAPLGNVQWREYEGSPVLLEVNPRPSGGLYRSSSALGVNLLWAAIRQEVLGDAGLGGASLTLPEGVETRTTTVQMTLPVGVLGETAVGTDAAVRALSVVPSRPPGPVDPPAVQARTA